MLEYLLLQSPVGMSSAMEESFLLRIVQRKQGGDVFLRVKPIFLSFTISSRAFAALYILTARRQTHCHGTRQKLELMQIHLFGRER
ncbi:hypothetical protein BLM15_09625 [Bosea sp. Tri-49]|nr:hypothetical protein BLM15_09625 [Bosea sp. Tri-49]